ncbi:MAG: ABC transporter permease, partial [Treponema sp.]|nr:ABC transporter permease [Treponema sp.]
MAKTDTSGRASGTPRLSSLLLRSDGAVSVVVVLLGFLFGTALVLAVGRNPVNMYKSILQSLTGLYQNR